MQAVSAQFLNFIRSQIKTPAAYVKVQLPTADGAETASQFLLPNVISVNMSRTQEKSSDVASFTLLDPNGQYSSLNPGSKYGAAFGPGEIDKKFEVYLGFRGQVGQGTSAYLPYTSDLLLEFTGFLQDDQQDLSAFNIQKTVNLIDLTSQFRFQVYDTFPHPLYGSQTNPYFDPTYNLTNPSNDGVTWICEGKMFTYSKSDMVYGTTHIDPAVYIDTTGGAAPQATPLASTAFTFDYANGIVHLGSAVPINSVVSLAGNPTFMAPEVMVRKMLVEKASWSPNFIQLDQSNILLPQYSGQNQAMWKCLEDIAGLTNPRLVPWTMRADNNGVVRFQESLIDGPTTRNFVDERDMLTCKYVNTSQNLRTVVRGDASVSTIDGDQAIISLAYDLRSVDKYGLTEATTIDPTLVTNLRAMTITQAISYLNQYCASVLAVNSRPIFTIECDIWPDPSIEIGDTIRVRSKRTGIDSYTIVKGIDKTVGADTFTHSLRLEEYAETVNYSMGLPSGVAQDGHNQSATVSPPSSALIGAVRFGNESVPAFPYIDSQFAEDAVTGKGIIPIWNAHNSNAPRFDVFLNSQAAIASASTTVSPSYQFDYQHLPPGYSWSPSTDAATQQLVYYGTDPSNGYTVFVGPDSVFYRFNHAAPILSTDYTSIWIPPGNTGSPAVGGTQAYTGAATTAYLWQWWYLCLDSNLGTGKMNRLVQRLNPSQDGAAISVPTTNGLWVTNTWTTAPGPVPGAAGNSLYGNMAVGLTDYTATPPGFVGANVMADGTHYGVAFGNAVTGSPFYINYKKKTRGHYCILAANNQGAVQFLRIPFALLL